MKIFCILAVLIAAAIAGAIPKTLVDRTISDLHERRMHPDDAKLQQAPKKLHPRQVAEQQSSFWLNAGQEFVQKQRNKKQNKGVAKNVIMFLGDGMSSATLAATRPYIGGEEKSLSFEEFPVVGMAKTYAVNYQVADSASTGTAYLSGVKANYGTVGLSAKVPRYHCTAQLDAAVRTSSIAKWAMDAGKVAGFVTTSEVTDASPAGLYAHSANRYWENDVEILARNCDPDVIDDIAKQLIMSEVGSKLRVIMGGGREQFRNTTTTDEEGGRGLRSDSRDLIQEWIESKRNERAEYVWNKVSRSMIKLSIEDCILKSIFALKV